MASEDAIRDADLVSRYQQTGRAPAFLCPICNDLEDLPLPIPVGTDVVLYCDRCDHTERLSSEHRDLAARVMGLLGLS